MNARVLLVVLLLVSPTTAYAQKGAPLKTKTDKYSYMLGLMFGKNLRYQEAEVDPDILLDGIYDGYKGSKAKISEEELPKLQEAYDKEAYERVTARMKKEGDALLLSNKKKPGVQVSKSGLQFEMTKAGKGPKVQKTDTVKVNYIGTFANGNKFESTIDMNEPVVMSYDQAIAGWQEALQMMNVGSAMRLVIPPNLAYGDKGSPPVIPPDAVLVFEMELLAINPPDAGGK